MERFLSIVATFLGWLYSVTHSYGLAIILLTVVVMVLITPLNLKSTRSMLEMQRLQPQLRRIQSEFKDDRERQQQEMMAFYKEHNINPLGGCLPMLAQAPVFIILYQVLRGITVRTGGYGSGIGHVVGQTRIGVTPTRWKLSEQPFEPRHLAKTSELYRSLSSTNKMNFLKVDLAISPSQAIALGFAVAIPFILLMIGMLVSQIIQNRQIQGRATGVEMPAQQQMIMKVLPFMLPVFSFGFPAGLGLYYLMQGVCRIGMNHYITRRFYGEGGLGHEAAEARKQAEAAKAKDKEQAEDAPKTPKQGSAGKDRTPPGGSKRSAADAKPAGRSGSAPKTATSPKSAGAQRKSSGGSATAGGAQRGRRSGTPRPRSGDRT